MAKDKNDNGKDGKVISWEEVLSLNAQQQYDVIVIVMDLKARVEALEKTKSDTEGVEVYDGEADK